MGKLNERAIHLCFIWRGEGKKGGGGRHGGSGQGGGCGGHAHQITSNFYSKYYNEINCLPFIL